MSKFQYYSMDSLIRFFLEQGKEGDCWDFKQEWHENIADLINKSKKDYAYTIINSDESISKNLVDGIKQIDGVLSVRVIY